MKMQMQFEISLRECLLILCICCGILPCTAGIHIEPEFHHEKTQPSLSAANAKLPCTSQHLQAEISRDGLWLISALPGQPEDRLSVKAVALGRTDHSVIENQGQSLLATHGEVLVQENRIRFMRAGLVEEYSAGPNGVRQDFLVSERPPGSDSGLLRLDLSVRGAVVKRTAKGAELLLRSSGRKLEYSHLRVVDSLGKDLRAEFHITDSGPEEEPAMAVLVEDRMAAYPVCIDPTFTDANWIVLSQGASDTVSAALVDESGNLYISGAFWSAGGVPVRCIAKWDGVQWRPLGSGMSSLVKALASHGGDLYAGGSFRTAGGIPANGIAKWDGTQWSPLGFGTHGSIYAMAAFMGDLYVGGSFTSLTNSDGSSLLTKGIARWNGSTWTGVGLGFGDFSTPTVTCLVADTTGLYVGGEFSVVTNNDGAAVFANHIAKWDGNRWSALGQGMNSQVNALSLSGGDLFAGGWFSRATNADGGAVLAAYIARWNGNEWSPLGTGMDNSVAALAAWGTNVYAAGSFTKAGGVTARAIASWNGTTWQALSQPLITSTYSGSISALAACKSGLFAGGSFDMATTGSPADRIAKWDGVDWSAVGPGVGGVYGTVFELVNSRDHLYAGGNFTSIGGQAAKRIAKFDGSRWTPLGAGVNSTVHAISVSGTNVYAGGAFTNAGGVAANRIARWDGAAWNALGSGVNGNVYALAFFNSNLYAGGNFTTAGGLQAYRVAKWNGTAWSSLRSGVSGGSYPTVYCFAQLGNELYVGGEFDAADSVANTRGIARWNGTAWNSVGGVSGSVYAMAASRTKLYAAGGFSDAGGIPALNVAVWDDSWKALGAGVGSPGEFVDSIVVSGSNVYVGGRFYIGGTWVNANIAKWDGMTWARLASGINNRVRTVAVYGPYLYVGGDFDKVGNLIQSPYFTKALDVTGDWIKIAHGVPGPNKATLSFVGVPGKPYTIESSSDCFSWIPLATAIADENGDCRVLDPYASDPKRFYRVVTP